MSKVKSDIFNDLNYQTQLLESLDWDEDQLQALLLYLQEVLNDEIILHPENIITTIADNFTVEAAKEVRQIFRLIAFEHGFLKGDDNEH